MLRVTRGITNAIAVDTNAPVRLEEFSMYSFSHTVTFCICLVTSFLENRTGNMEIVTMTHSTAETLWHSWSFSDCEFCVVQHKPIDGLHWYKSWSTCCSRGWRRTGNQPRDRPLHQEASDCLTCGRSLAWGHQDVRHVRYSQVLQKLFGRGVVGVAVAEHPKCQGITRDWEDEDDNVEGCEQDVLQVRAEVNPLHGVVWHSAGL